MELRATKIDRRGRRDEVTIELPDGRGDTGWDRMQQVLLAVAALDSDMDVVVAIRVVRSGSTGTAGQIASLDPDEHSAQGYAGK